MEINVVKCFSSRKLLAAMPFTQIIGKRGHTSVRMTKSTFRLQWKVNTEQCDWKLLLFKSQWHRYLFSQWLKLPKGNCVNSFSFKSLDSLLVKLFIAFSFRRPIDVNSLRENAHLWVPDFTSSNHRCIVVALSRRGLQKAYRHIYRN